MTWLFNKEKELMKQGLIAMFLYQNEEVRQKNMPLLKRCNDDPAHLFLTFKPYFHNDSFPFIAERSGEYFGCGRISRRTRTNSPPTRSTSTNTSSPPSSSVACFWASTRGAGRKSENPTGGYARRATRGR